MNAYKNIESKIYQFIRKYYTNELIKGSILFLSLGALYFLLTLIIEHFFWLRPSFRTLLFWLFVLAELLLLYQYIFKPIFKLYGLQKGLSKKESALIIGSHFPEVKDKLLNIIELKSVDSNSELLLASIDQKSKDIQPIPFNKAINFKSNTKYLKYGLLPFFIWMGLLLFGQVNLLDSSLNRMVNHSTEFIPPAPFSYELVNKSLSVIQGESLKIEFNIVGNALPSDSKIYYNNQTYFLSKNAVNKFSYTFDKVNDEFNFRVGNGNVFSKSYNVSIVKTPQIENLRMKLFYPKHVGLKNKMINGTGNANVPHGTFIKWELNTKHTQSVDLIKSNDSLTFNKSDDNFELKEQALRSFNYIISASNSELMNYENLRFSIGIVRDELPVIRIDFKRDSLNLDKLFFAGKISDDYGFKKLNFVYYKAGDISSKIIKDLLLSNESVQSFYYAFPNGLDLEEGVNYEMYFEVIDNDAVSGFKRSVSQIFRYKELSKEEELDRSIKEQKESIDNIESSFEENKEARKKLKEIQNKLQSQKSFTWNDKQKIKNLIKRQRDHQNILNKQKDLLQKNIEKSEENRPELKEKKDDLKKTFRGVK